MGRHSAEREEKSMEKRRGTGEAYDNGSTESINETDQPDRAEEALACAGDKVMRPKAPTDPKAARPRVYLMLDSLVEGRAGEYGEFADYYFLSGRVEAKLLSVLPGLDREIAAQLQQCRGFCDIVEEIGVSVMGTEENWRSETASFCLQGGGEENGLYLSADLPCTGEEVRIPVAGTEQAAKAEGVLSAAVFRFPFYMMARATITLYLKAGISVPLPASVRSQSA